VKKKNKFKVGLALGGGGVRGLAHIGVLKVLNSYSIPIDLIVGTSMGAIIGATFCLNPDANALEEKILEVISHPEVKKMESFFAPVTEENQQKFVVKRLLSRIKDICMWNLRAAKKWLIRSEPIINLLQGIFNNKRFSDTKIPFACAAVDMNTASCVIIKKGKILQAVLASSSMPGVFAPMKHGSQLLVDGGVLSVLPARQVRNLGADFVIGVDLTPPYSARELPSGLDVMFQADWIKSYQLNKQDLKYCDWVIKPDIVNFNWSAFSKGPFCIHQGELAALRDINEIKRALNRKRRFYFIKRFLKKFTIEKSLDYTDYAECNHPKQ
jgi:NTE family protein